LDRASSLRYPNRTSISLPWAARDSLSPTSRSLASSLGRAAREWDRPRRKRVPDLLTPPPGPEFRARGRGISREGKGIGEGSGQDVVRGGPGAPDLSGSYQALVAPVALHRAGVGQVMRWVSWSAASCCGSRVAAARYSSQTWGGLAVGELAGILSSDILGKAAGIVGPGVGHVVPRGAGQRMQHDEPGSGAGSPEAEPSSEVVDLGADSGGRDVGKGRCSWIALTTSVPALRSAVASMSPTSEVAVTDVKGATAPEALGLEPSHFEEVLEAEELLGAARSWVRRSGKATLAARPVGPE